MSDFIELESTGKILWEEFMQPLGITAYRLAKEVGVPANRISTIIQGKRTVSAETSLLLDKYFGLSEGFFFRLQRDEEMRKARRMLGNRLKQVVPLPRAQWQSGAIV